MENSHHVKLMNSAIIGAISLNVSLLLYLIHYFPQLIHNQRDGQLNQLSLGFHYLLTLAYLSDLNYGYGLGLPWQYRLVSAIGLCCLLYQHRQLAKIHRNNKQFRLASGVLLIGVGISLWALQGQFSLDYYLLMGYLAQVAGFLFLIPQIIKNWHSQAAIALSLGYLILDWICYACDNVSAWVFNWPLPSKMGSILGLCLMSILLLQWFLLEKKPAS